VRSTSPLVTKIKINGPALKARNSISALQASTLFLMCLTRGDALRACPWLLYCAPSALALAPAFYSTPSALRSHLFSIPRLRRFALAPRIGIVLAHTSHLHVSRHSILNLTLKGFASLLTHSGFIGVFTLPIPRVLAALEPWAEISQRLRRTFEADAPRTGIAFADTSHLHVRCAPFEFDFQAIEASLVFNSNAAHR